MKQLFLIIFFSIFFFTCREEYVSPVSSPNTGYLVVEGGINSGPGNTTIKLSRTTPLAEGRKNIETGATVTVLDENGNSFPLLESSVHGDYVANGLNLNPTLKYKLRIVANQKEYLSDYVAVNVNPPIDTISWSRASDGVHIFANTHDPQNKAKYFQWDYIATWEFHSEYIPSLKYDLNDPYFVVYFDPINWWRDDSSLYKCWQTDTSRYIILGSTVKYAVDSISNPLTVIEPASWKLSVLYSINVRQYTYTKDGYEFLQKMKKNSEQLGSVFDAQPSELQGNIHCTSNPNEVVIGYVSSCDIREKRAYINLPGWNYKSDCYLLAENNDTAFIRINNYYANGIPHILPVYFLTLSLPPPNGFILTFTAADKFCVDCRLRGTSSKPAYWP